MKKYIMAVIAATVVTASSLYASYDQPVFIRGVRPMGMGGAFIALSDDQNAIFYNPAGITQRQGSQFTLFEMPLNISDDIFQVYNFYKDNEEQLKNFDSFNNQDPAGGAALLNKITDSITKYRPNLRTGLPNTSYLSGPGFITWGAGVFNQEDLGFQFNSRMLVPSVSFWGNADVMLAVPLAHRFDALPFAVPGKLSAGATLKYINRAKIEEFDRSVLTFDDFDPQLQWGNGFGFDLGALYQPTDRWNAGLQITDVGGTKLSYAAITDIEEGQAQKPAFDSVIKPAWNIGALYTPEKIYYWPGRYINTLDRLQIAVDLRDVMNSDETVFDATFFKKLHMGAEFRWGPGSLRAGFNSGYPTFGAGVRVPYLGLRVDYAFWGEEMGRYAGQIPNWNHQLTIALSWGDAKGKVYGGGVAKKMKAAPPVEPAVAAPAAEPAAPATAVVPSAAPAESAPAIAPVTNAAPGQKTDEIPAKGNEK